MAAEGEAETGVVGKEVFACGWSGDWERILMCRGAGQQAMQGLGAGGLPQGLAAVAGKGGERTGGGEHAQRAGVQLGAGGEIGGVLEGVLAAGGDDAHSGILAETAHHAQAQAHRRLGGALQVGLRRSV